MNNKLFVGNVSYDTTELELQDLFAAHGAVEEVNLVTDRATGRPRGFAFVTMATAEEAAKAVQMFDGAVSSTPTVPILPQFIELGSFLCL